MAASASSSATSSATSRSHAQLSVTFFMVHLLSQVARTSPVLGEHEGADAGSVVDGVEALAIVTLDHLEGVELADDGRCDVHSEGPLNLSVAEELELSPTRAVPDDHARGWLYVRANRQDHQSLEAKFPCVRISQNMPSWFTQSTDLLALSAACRSVAQ